MSRLTQRREVGKSRRDGSKYWGVCNRCSKGYTKRFSDSDICGNTKTKMKLNYYKDTDSLYIDLSSKPSAHSREISEGVVLDYDAEGNIVGIDIDNAGRKVDLGEISLSRIPTK